jgi:hypothetical protein
MPFQRQGGKCPGASLFLFEEDVKGNIDVLLGATIILLDVPDDRLVRHLILQCVIVVHVCLGLLKELQVDLIATVRP